MKVAAVLLAAGGSSRMGHPKALTPWGSGSFLSRMLETLGKAGLGPGAVVVGAAGDRIRPAAEERGAEVLVNDAWRRGRMGSVRLAARHALRSSAHLLLWPVDCPAVGADTLERLLAAARAAPEADLVSSYAGRGGHPVLLSPATCRALAEGRGRTLREVLGSGEVARVHVPVDDDAVLDNVDTPGELRRFLAARGGEGRRV